MVVNIEQIAKRLKTARSQLGYEVSGISAATGIPEPRIVELEAGAAVPTGDELLILASAYDRNFLDFFEDRQRDPFGETEILFRRHGNDFSASDRRSVQEFLYLCEIEEYLQKSLARPTAKFSFNAQGRYFKGHGEEAAAALRNHLGYSERELPRDIYADFRSIGIHVFRRRLENSSISGLYIDHPVAGHCVLVNFSEDIYRQRFSVAHEAAHTIFDASESVVVSFVDHQSDLKEVRANRFASCFLLPIQFLRLLPRPLSQDQAAHWAQKFRVSTTALAVALKEAELASAAEFETIRMARVPTIDKVDPEAPENLSPMQLRRRKSLLERGLSDHYVGLCFDAYNAGVISAGRLAEALRSDHAGSREISVLYGRSIHHGA